MSETITVDELGALNLGFHLLARNLFTYSAEIGVFMAITDKDKKILAIRMEALEEINELIDFFSDTIVRSGTLPKVGSYEEDYTVWSYKSETAMLPEYLRESNAHRNKFIRLLNTLTANNDNPPAQEVVKLFKQAIATRGETLIKMNALVNDVCDPVDIAEFDTSHGDEIEAPGH
jgi:hypothetical protein